ncbi:RloB family protein [Arcicella rosea]|uniref:RloB-like protein n=1 Tax=Arcicella rosea TaxID=502909 RepID=A0A841EQU0_9BACT|nr:RloB family protein [Arcicella rosea]MBB6003383.1 hypothetical protein [Arcicella rosea]
MQKENRNYKKSIPHRDSSWFIIICEGAKTEVEYFTYFHKLKQQRIKIKVVPPSDNKSAPKWVLDKAVKESENLNFNNYDQLWMVMDIDRWELKDLHTIQNECDKIVNWNLAISNPCFEIWLLAHAKDLETFSSQSGRELKRHFGLLKDEGLFPKNPLQNLHLAIERASKADNSPHFIPERGRTKVYLLAQELIKRIGEHHFK